MRLTQSNHRGSIANPKFWDQGFVVVVVVTSQLKSRIMITA